MDRCPLQSVRRSWFRMVIFINNDGNRKTFIAIFVLRRLELRFIPQQKRYYFAGILNEFKKVKKEVILTDFTKKKYRLTNTTNNPA